MNIKDLLLCSFVAILCGSIFVDAVNANSKLNTKKDKAKHKKRRPCRCKKIYKELSDSIDSKFKQLNKDFSCTCHRETRMLTVRSI